MQIADYVSPMRPASLLMIRASYTPFLSLLVSHMHTHLSLSRSGFLMFVVLWSSGAGLQCFRRCVFDGLSVLTPACVIVAFCFVLCFSCFAFFRFWDGGLPFTPLEKGAASAMPIPTGFLPAPGPSKATGGRLHAAGPARAGPI